MEVDSAPLGLRDGARNLALALRRQYMDFSKYMGGGVLARSFQGFRYGRGMGRD